MRTGKRVVHRNQHDQTIASALQAVDAFELGFGNACVKHSQLDLASDQCPKGVGIRFLPQVHFEVREAPLELADLGRHEVDDEQPRHGDRQGLRVAAG